MGGPKCPPLPPARCPLSPPHYLHPGNQLHFPPELPREGEQRDGLEWTLTGQCVGHRCPQTPSHPWLPPDLRVSMPSAASSKIHLRSPFMQGAGLGMQSRTVLAIWGLQRGVVWGGPKDRAPRQMSKPQGTGLGVLKGQVWVQ